MSYQTNPPASALDVTESDTDVFDPPTRALWIGTGGDVTVRMAGGRNAITFSNVADGTLLPVVCIGVNTATTASDIVRLW